MDTLRAPVHAELVVKKSRFLACVQPVPGRAEAVAEVARLRALHPGSAHVCWALMAGGQSAANDDCEPGGTAGRPMLEVLRRQQLDGVLATVVRWFGGVKLGAGGLVRAYTEVVAQALLQGERVTLQRQCAGWCEVPYAREGWARRHLEAHGALLLEARHANLVFLRFAAPQADLARLLAVLHDAGAACAADA